jgi:hypothetical protein
MADYREIRLRLNLRRQRDRWLASALDEAAEELGTPVASIARRALAAYLRDRVTDQAVEEPGSPSEAGKSHPTHDAHELTSASEARRATDETTAAGGVNSRLHDVAADLFRKLASMGTPPELPTGG